MRTEHRNFKYRIYPTPEQEKLLLRWEGILRFLWNLAHEQRLMGLARPKSERVFPSYYQQKREMTQLLEEYPWIEIVQCQARQETLADLDKAWSRCFKKLARRPHFKRRGDAMRIYAPSTVPFTVEGDRKTGRLSFEGPRYKPLGVLKIVLDRPILGTVTSWSIKRSLNEWYALPGCDIQMPDSTPVNDKAVGLDRGVAVFLADSDGGMVPNLRAREKLDQRIARAQRQVERKKKGSQNQKKARLKVAKLARLAARQREVAIGTASKFYAENYGTVVIEKLNIKGMTASAKGDLENPGTNVAQKSGLNKAILDVGWGKFGDALKYKVTDRGGRLLEVNPAGTSQTCPECKFRDPESRITQSLFRCTQCGHEENADTVGAKNIKERGLNLLAPPEPKKRVKTFQRGRKPKLVETAVKPTVVLPTEVTS